jgi:hypothetical protein
MLIIIANGYGRRKPVLPEVSHIGVAGCAGLLLYGADHFHITLVQLEVEDIEILPQTVRVG